MDYNFLLDGINKIESMQEEQALAIAMLQGYIFAEKEKNDVANATSSKKKTPTVIKIDVPKVSKNGSVVVITGEELRKYNGKTVRKRSDGRYEIRYYDGKKYHSIYGKTQSECIEKLKQTLIVNKQKEINYKTITLGEWLKQWLKLYKEGKVAHSTLDQMQRYLREVEPLHHYTLKKISPIILQEFFSNIDKPRKREKIQTYLKDAFNKALKAKIIDTNPFEGVESIKRVKKETRALTREEEIRLVEACNTSQFGNLFLLCLYTGVRIGEALALTIKDVDFVRKKININKSINDFGETVEPKTRTSIRTIPLFENAENILKEIVNNLSNNMDKLFTYTKTSYQNKIAHFKRELKIDNLSSHMLRHTFATRCAEAGVPPKVVQKWLGHSTLIMTMNVYTHVNNDYEKQMAEKVNKFVPEF